MKLVPALLIFVLVFCTNATEKPADKIKNGFTVIELFTSEGCSSCPPADRLLTEIKEEHAGENVLVLAYHVDYWDHLGWEDRFSSAANTERQNYYAGIFKLSSIYTPQAIVNGTKEFIGSEKENLEKAIATSSIEKNEFELSAEEKKPGEIFVVVNKLISYKNRRILIALVEKQASSKIKRGENAGKELSHINIVRNFTIKPAENVSVKFTRKEKTKDDFFIAALLQDEKSGSILGYEITDIRN